MAARFDRHFNAAFRRTDAAGGCKQLIGRDQFIIAVREQKRRDAQAREVDQTTERLESSGANAILPEQPGNHLQIIRAGQVNRRKIPTVETTFERVPLRRTDIWRNLQDICCYLCWRPECEHAKRTISLKAASGKLAASRKGKDSPAVHWPEPSVAPCPENGRHRPEPSIRPDTSR
jgi:hypothetical protein